MAMANKGLAKLLEELGELAQISAKKLAYLETDMHPDGQGSMKRRMEDEMADVKAAIDFVAKKLELNIDYIEERYKCKSERFDIWDNQ